MNSKVFLSSRGLIHHFLESSADLFPDKVALIHEGARVTYEEINSYANGLARWLRDNNVESGDRVALLIENSLEYVTGYYGILKAGAVAVPFGTDLKTDGLNHLLHEISPKALISNARFERLLKSADLDNCNLDSLILKNPSQRWGSSSFKAYEWEDIIHYYDGANLNTSIAENALANIIFTSGSTGKPKGVMLSHRNIATNTASIVQYLALTDKDVQMIVLPFFYVMGKSLLNTHFAAGGTVVINNKFAFPASVISQMVEEEVTGFSGVPSTYAYLINRSPLAMFRDKLHTLRYCSQAGGHMSRTIKEELRKVLPVHTDIYIMYGATEASARLSYLEPARLADKIDSIGKAIPGVRLAVVNKDGRELPAGEIGELAAKGLNIMQGYWKDPDATDNVLKNGRYLTGDLAYRDDEGYFYVTGRNDNMLKVGGHRINPIEIEEVMMESGLLIETVVIGVPDTLQGHKLVALAIAKSNTDTPDDVLKYCAGKLPKFKMPATIKFIRNMPKSQSGKIDRKRCLELLASHDIAKISAKT